METGYEVPLAELLRKIPDDYRAVIECDWNEEGLCIWHRFIPVGHLMHKAADRILELENQIKSISPHPTMTKPETNCPRIDGSKLSAHDQVTRDEFDQEAM